MGCVAICLAMAGCATAPEEKTEAQEAKVAEAHAHYAQAMIYRADGDMDKWIEELSRASKGDPSNAELAKEVGSVYMEQMGDPAKAVELLTGAAAVHGAPASIFAELGDAYSELGKEGKAIAATEEAVRRDPKSAEYLADLAGLYAAEQAGHPGNPNPAATKALSLVKQAEAMDTNGWAVGMKAATVYEQLNDTTNAIRVYTNLLARFPNIRQLQVDVHRELAKIYLRLGDGPNIRKELEAVVSNSPSDPQTLYFLGTVELEAQQPDQAELFFRRVLQQDPDYEMAYYQLAMAQSAQKHKASALDTIAQAEQRYSTNFESQYAEARVYAGANDYTNAVVHFSLAETLAQGTTNQPNEFFYFEAGAARERAGDFDKAVSYFQQCIKLAPDMAPALNYYGYMLADRGIKLNKAHEMIEKAVRLDPNNAAYVDSLGWVLFRLGKKQDGLAQIQKAIQMSNTDPDATLYEHLGDIYASLNEPDKAREAWQKSVSLEANPEVQKKIEGISSH